MLEERRRYWNCATAPWKANHYLYWLAIPGSLLIEPTSQAKTLSDITPFGFWTTTFETLRMVLWAPVIFVHWFLKLCILMRREAQTGQHSGAVVSTVASQQEGPELDFWVLQLPPTVKNIKNWGLVGWLVSKLPRGCECECGIVVFLYMSALRWTGRLLSPPWPLTG